MSEPLLTPLPVEGYQPQPQSRVDQVNSFKEMEERILRQLDLLSGDLNIDQDWLHRGRLELQHAFMMINRSVFQPQRIRLPEDPPVAT